MSYRTTDYDQDGQRVVLMNDWNWMNKTDESENLQYFSLLFCHSHSFSVDSRSFTYLSAYGVINDKSFLCKVHNSQSKFQLNPLWFGSYFGSAPLKTWASSSFVFLPFHIVVFWNQYIHLHYIELEICVCILWCA